MHSVKNKNKIIIISEAEKKMQKKLGGDKDLTTGDQSDLSFSNQITQEKLSNHELNKEMQKL